MRLRAVVVHSPFLGMGRKIGKYSDARNRQLRLRNEYMRAAFRFLNTAALKLRQECESLLRVNRSIGQAELNDIGERLVLVDQVLVEP